MEPPKSSLTPIPGANRAWRKRLGLRQELELALLPTVVAIGVLIFVQAFSRQRLLYASLASSAFLIYLDPEHGTNSARTLILAQMGAAAIGFTTYSLLGHGFLAGGCAMLLTIIYMIVLDVVHPPAVSTSLSFAFRAAAENNLVIFALAVALVVTLLALQRATVWLLARDDTKPDNR